MFRLGTCQRRNDANLCNSNSDCNFGFSCFNGICNENSNPETCSIKSPCQRGEFFEIWIFLGWMIHYHFVPGQTCCSDGSCSLSCSTCSGSNPSGTCPLGFECSRRGRCKEIKCFSPSNCPRDFDCVQGVCEGKTLTHMRSIFTQSTETWRLPQNGISCDFSYFE